MLHRHLYAALWPAGLYSEIGNSGIRARYERDDDFQKLHSLLDYHVGRHDPDHQLPRNRNLAAAEAVCDGLGKIFLF